MSQVFVNLPAPAANGSGAAVDVSSFGPLKTIAVSGGADALILIEMSNDVLGVRFAPVAQFSSGGEKTLNLACRWLRATVQSYRSGTPAVNVGGTNEGTSFFQLVAPAGDGAGAAVDVSGQGLFKTIQVAGVYTGNVNVEISEDGVTDWATIASFQNPSQQSLTIAAHHMRVRRNGSSPINPGLPIIWIGAADIISGDRGVAISAGSQSVGTGTVAFVNSNGVTFGMSGSSQVTASVDAVKSISAGGTAFATGPGVILSNGNGITFGVSGNTITASVQTVGGTATGVGISAGTEVATTGAVVFSNSNGVTFGLHNQTLTASVAPSLAISAGSQSVATGTLAFVNSNGVTFGMSGSSQITASAFQPTIQRVVGFTATGGETQFTVTFTPAAPTTAYSVFGQANGVAAIPVLDIPAGSASRSLTAFGVVPTNSLSSGDQFAFLVFQS